MKHVKTFESYLDTVKSVPKTIASFFSKKEDEPEAKEKPLQEECDDYINQHLNKLKEDVVLVEFALEYIEFLRYTIMQNKLELREYYSTEAKLCASKPYPLNAERGFGKELLSSESLEADEVHSAAVVMGYVNSVRKPERFLADITKKGTESPLDYLSAAGPSYQEVLAKPESSSKHTQLAILSFVLFTYHKLRPLFKHDKVKELTGVSPTATGEFPDKPGVGFNRNTAGLGVIASIAALGKLVLPETSFQSQGSDTSGCFRTCQRMVGAMAPPHLGIKMAKETSSGVVKLPTFNKGVETIEKNLAAGKPIIVGVDDKKGSVNHDQTTDHFVVIVGSGKDDNGTFYRFYDPGTAHRDKGTHEENKFYVDDNGLLSGTSAYNKDNKRYTVSWVRPAA